MFILRYPVLSLFLTLHVYTLFIYLDFYYNGESEEQGRRKAEGVGVMKDKELMLEHSDSSH